MNIIYISNPDMNARDIFKMTQGGADKLSNHIGEVITITDAIVYEDVNTRGEDVTILVIKTADGDILASSSGTVRRKFSAMCASFADCFPIEDVKIINGTSKAGRTYCDIELA